VRRLRSAAFSGAPKRAAALADAVAPDDVARAGDQGKGEKNLFHCEPP
jgi:hypothetical protein